MHFRIIKDTMGVIVSACFMETCYVMGIAFHVFNLKSILFKKLAMDRVPGFSFIDTKLVQCIGSVRNTLNMEVIWFFNKDRYELIKVQQITLTIFCTHIQNVSYKCNWEVKFSLLVLRHRNHSVEMQKVFLDVFSQFGYFSDQIFLLFFNPTFDKTLLF